MTMTDRLVVRLLPAVPRRVVRRISAPYLAGETRLDALRTIAALNERGAMATVDVLGEQFRSLDQADELVSEYVAVLDDLFAWGLDGNLSVKMTGLGLELDPDACQANLEVLVARAEEHGNFVRVEMEDSSTTTATLEAYRRLRAQGHENVGIVLQAYLRRTPADVESLASLQPNVRLCKGIFAEPLSAAYHDPDAVRASYLECLERLFAMGCYVGVATHDEWLQCEALRLVDKYGLKPTEFEFQMLLGAREDLGEVLVGEGHRLRVYVPYGEHWYEYSLRRVQENPAVAGVLARDVVRRGASGAAATLRRARSALSGTVVPHREVGR